jgi:hypothetical protein
VDGLPQVGRPGAGKQGRPTDAPGQTAVVEQVQRTPDGDKTSAGQPGALLRRPRLGEAMNDPHDPNLTADISSDVWP